MVHVVYVARVQLVGNARQRRVHGKRGRLGLVVSDVGQLQPRQLCQVFRGVWRLLLHAKGLDFGVYACDVLVA